MVVRTLLCFFLLCSVTPAAVAQETKRVYLSGRGKDDAVTWKFFCTTGSHAGYWTNIPVPSNWELHGFGTLRYSTDDTNSASEEGRYEHTFKVPSEWSNWRVFLVFEGVMTDTTAFINSQPVGPTHQGGFYRFKYEVSRLLKHGSANLLEVTVAKKSAESSVNDAERTADYWIFGGIFRPVYLEVTPPQFIERVAINAHADGKFSIDVFANGEGAADRIEARIKNFKGKRVGDPFAAALLTGKTLLQTKITGPRTWTAETPNLYRVELNLKAGDRVLHKFEQRFGFRTFEVRDGDGLYLNGRRIVLKGVNRHSAWPDSGRCLSTAVHRLDIETMKDMNLNAVRMSHYPPDAEFLDLCDEMGLYVLDELGGWQKAYGTSVGTKLVEEMVTRDANHPSILFWDNGNEGGNNHELDALFARFDPQSRRVLHPWSPFSGVNTTHYLPYETALKASAGTPTYLHESKPAEAPDSQMLFMPTEFLHGLYDGGAGAGLEDHWGIMSSTRYLAGGFIWALMDEGVRHDGIMDLWGNRAPDGIVGPYREREGSFYTIKELWSPLQVKDRVLPPDFSGELTIQNDYSFTDASQCQFEWQLRRFYGPFEKKPGFRVLGKGKAHGPPVAPGQSGRLQLQLPSDWKDADALDLRATDPAGRELWTWVWPVPGLQTYCSRLQKANVAEESVRVLDSETELQVRTGKLLLGFDKQSGELRRVQRGQQGFSLLNGPRLTSGNRGRLVSLVHRMQAGDAVLKAAYDGDLKELEWRIQPNGWLRCDYTFKASGLKESCGVVFDYPEAMVKSKKWLGLGPYRVWKNRQRGGTLNVWQNEYNNTITGYSDWIYPEFKGCFAEVRWMQLHTTEGPITAAVHSNGLFVQVLKPEQPPENLRAKTSFTLPACGLGFLHAIPPVGTKFGKADGPQGQFTQTDGEYHGSISLFFGEVP